MTSPSRRALGAVPGLLLLIGLAAPATAQSFGLDDNPAAPLVGPPGVIPGFGAEDPFGLVGPPLAPSPSLAFLGPLGDGAIFAPGPVIQHPGPNGFYMSAFSSNHAAAGGVYFVEFSVDRVTIGVAGTAVGAEALAGQAHGDVYTGTTSYLAPGVFAGSLGPGPFAGVLPSMVGGGPGNTLTIDDSAFGLLTPLGVVPPGVVVPPPVVSPALHDNLDSFDNQPLDGNGDFAFDVDAYFSIYPDEAFPLGVAPGDVFVVALGDGGAFAVPYAPFGSMGLVPDDAVDALVVFDSNNRPISLGQPGAPGAIEPVIDYALFSLAPGSTSLQLYGLDAADVFFTDFTGAFAVYAPSFSLGLLTTPPGLPFMGDNVDALEVTVLPQLTITDGSCRFELRNITGQRTSSSAGDADLITGTTDQLFQNWFWYRGPGDTREYALSNQIYLSVSGNRARTVYLEPIADGTIPGALLFDLEYTISEINAPPLGASARCEVVIAVKVRNLTAAAANVALFSYNDMDLIQSATNDRAWIQGVDNQVQRISDALVPSGNAIYKVSSTDHASWEIGPYASIRNALVDAAVSGLAGGVSPFGPGDYTGAQEWQLALGPAGSVIAPPFDEWVGSVVLEVKIPAAHLRPQGDPAPPVRQKTALTVEPVPGRSVAAPPPSWTNPVDPH